MTTDALPTDAQMRAIRAEVGSDPADSVIEDLWMELGNAPAVALAVLRPRLADALTAAAAGSVTIPGVISVSAPASPQYLREQVQRLEAALQQDTGSAESDMGIGVTVMRRRSQSRGLTLRP